MDTKDYADVIELCNEGIKMLEAYFSNSGEMKLSKIKDITFLLMDGKKVDDEFLKKIPAKGRRDFSTLITGLHYTSAYTSHPKRNPQTSAILNSVQIIKSTFEGLVKQSILPDKIFYSWQSSTTECFNRYFIRDCLKKAVKEINKEIPIDAREQTVPIKIDSDTKGTSGSPHIFNTILGKIDKSTIFVADVSLIDKKTCNSNVMLELGYAVKSLGFDKIIMIFNTALGSLDDLPFDLRSQRIATYSFKNGDDEKMVTKKLTALFKETINAVL